MEAKLCPDGSSVGRSGPKCEFTACLSPKPTADPTANWKTYTSTQFGFMFKYPNDWKGQTNEGLNNGQLSFWVDRCSGMCPDSINQQIHVLTFDNPSKLSVQEFLNQNSKLFLNAKGFERIDPVDGHDAMSILYPKGKYPTAIETLIENATNIIDVVCTTCGDNFDNQILSTFKFTDALSPTLSPAGMRFDCDGGNGCGCYGNGECKSNYCKKSKADSENAINAGVCQTP
jgi:hypothetical protein